jgi:O-antigen/teichoic acid export membrane protein
LKSSHLIAFNTIVSYGQSLVGLVVGLFSARWVLEALGAVDFGLFGVVGSIILLIAFLNGGLSVGVGRFYAYSIGRGKNLSQQESHKDLLRWFNTALSTHVALGLVILALGWPAGEYAIRHWLNIPPDRLEACVLVFRFSLGAAFFSVVSVPFTAMYAAHQALAELALFGVLHSLLILGLSWTLLSSKTDPLVFYGIGMAFLSVGIGALQIIRATTKFKACRPKRSYFVNGEYFRQLFSYVGWKMFGISCVVLRSQGIPLLTNLFFGPVMNAAYSIANRVSLQATNLSSSLLNAFQPAVVAAEASGNREQMIAMSLRVCRFGTLLVLLFSVPLIVEMHTVLAIWLKEPPPYAAGLCQWMLGLLVIDKMTAGAMLAVNAYGKIALYEIIQGSAFLLALPIMWLLHSNGVAANSIGIALFASTSLYCAGRLAFANVLVSFPIVKWTTTVVVPAVIVLVATSCTAYISLSFFNAGLLRIVITTLLTATVSLALGASILLSRQERLTGSQALTILFYSVVHKLIPSRGH